MRNQTAGGIERLQYDTQGQLVARLVKTGFGAWVLLPEPDFLPVRDGKGKFGLWDCKQRKQVEFAKAENT